MSTVARFLPLIVIVAILSWASAYPVVRIALHDLPPVPLAAARYAIAAMLAGGWLAWVRPPLPARGDWLRILACGAIGIALYNILFNTGEMTVSAGAASLLISAMPLIAALIAVAVMGERLSPWGWAGSLCSFAGVVLIAEGQVGGVALGSGATLVFGAAVCGALYTTLQKKLVLRYGALPTICYILIAGAACLSPWLPQALAGLATAPVRCWGAALELGIFPAAIGYAAWAFVVGHMGAARGAGLLYLLPPVTLVLAFVLTGEIPTARTLAGGVIVMVGVVVTNTYGHPGRQMRRQGG
ncbi:DMT family transporter [Gluconacetobacter sp. 1c LMG 22058]|uniref:DMT family transporter n=1 Tax=Gluconacetobacter dulcium TaxID=2729096 RepID=A0A7W4PHD9_9PROT|nr:DMT family transporter [Gluconacetobacter dulcium]MBB2197650.1 DMT family transporter [Gluconacetobacter dulcium]